MLFFFCFGLVFLYIDNFKFKNTVFAYVSVFFLLNTLSKLSNLSRCFLNLLFLCVLVFYAAVHCTLRVTVINAV